MGLASAVITLANPRRSDLKPVDVEALADSGAVFLVIPQHVANQLELETNLTKEVTTADGKRTVCPYVGPIHVHFDNRDCYVGAIILGDEVLLAQFRWKTWTSSCCLRNVASPSIHSAPISLPARSSKPVIFLLYVRPRR